MTLDGCTVEDSEFEDINSLSTLQSIVNEVSNLKVWEGADSMKRFSENFHGWVPEKKAVRCDRCGEFHKYQNKKEHRIKETGEGGNNKIQNTNETEGIARN